MEVNLQTPKNFILLPGLALAAAIGLVSMGVNSLYPPVSSVLIAVLLGFIFKNTAGVGQRFQPGAQYSVKSLLKLAIILLGARLSFLDLVHLGLRALLLVVLCITIALLLVGLLF